MSTTTSREALVQILCDPAFTFGTQRSPRMIAQAKDALRLHWPEYLMEAGELGLFMIAACFTVALLEHPASLVQQAIASPMVRRVLIGLAMGVTAISLIYSPWGKQSGAHFNPAVTLTFLRLRKIAFWDAVFYIA